MSVDVPMAQAFAADAVIARGVLLAQAGWERDGQKRAVMLLSQAVSRVAAGLGWASPQVANLAYIRDLLAARESYDAQGRLRGFGGPLG